MTPCSFEHTAFRQMFVAEERILMVLISFMESKVQRAACMDKAFVLKLCHIDAINRDIVHGVIVYVALPSVIRPTETMLLVQHI